MSTPSNSTRSIFSFAWSAIHAGHAACASRVSAETRSDLQRNELVLSGIQENVGVTAEDWGSFWGGGSRETWRDEDLGAGNGTSVSILIESDIGSVKNRTSFQEKGVYN